MNRFHFELKETIVTLLCDTQYRKAGEDALLRIRSELETTIQEDPEFQSTHKAHLPLEHAPGFVKSMCLESARVGIGPMASVAGTFAGQALDDMAAAGASQAIVDNGGDIAMKISKPVFVGIYAGQSKIRNLAFEVEARESKWGICTSSGTVGHSFSYGNADAAVVLSPNITLADAAATALGNRIHSEADLKTCFDFLEPLEEIEGALVILGDKMALWGDLPRLVRMEVDETLVTAGMVSPHNSGRSETSRR